MKKGVANKMRIRKASRILKASSPRAVRSSVNPSNLLVRSGGIDAPKPPCRLRAEREEASKKEARRVSNVKKRIDWRSFMLKIIVDFGIGLDLIGSEVFLIKCYIVDDLSSLLLKDIH